MLDLEKRCEYKSEYLKLLGLEVGYTNAPEVEVFFPQWIFQSQLAIAICALEKALKNKKRSRKKVKK